MSTKGEQAVLVGDTPNLLVDAADILAFLKEDLNTQCSSLDERLKEKLMAIKTSLATWAPPESQLRSPHSGSSGNETDPAFGGGVEHMGKSAQYRDPVPTPVSSTSSLMARGGTGVDSTQPGLGGGASFFLEMILSMVCAADASSGSGSPDPALTAHFASSVIELLNTPGTRNQRITPFAVETLLRHFQVGEKQQHISPPTRGGSCQQHSNALDMCNQLRLMAAVRSGQLEKLAACLQDSPPAYLEDPEWMSLVHADLSRGIIQIHSDETKDSSAEASRRGIQRFINVSQKGILLPKGAAQQLDVGSGMCVSSILGHTFLSGGWGGDTTATNQVMYVSPPAAAAGTYELLPPITPSAKPPAKFSPQSDAMFISEDGSPVRLHLQRGTSNQIAVHCTKYNRPNNIAAETETFDFAPLLKIHDVNSVFTSRSTLTICGDEHHAYLVALKEGSPGRRGSIVASNAISLLLSPPSTVSNKPASLEPHLQLSEGIQCMRFMRRTNPASLIGEPPSYGDMYSSRDPHREFDQHLSPLHLIFNSKSHLNCGGFSLSTLRRSPASATEFNLPQQGAGAFTVEMYVHLLSLPSSIAADPPATQPANVTAPIDTFNSITTTSIFRCGSKETEEVFIDIFCDQNSLVLRGGHRTPSRGVQAAVCSLDFPRKLLHMWNHVALTFTGCRWILFLNGLQVASAETPTSAYDAVSTATTQQVQQQGCTLGKGLVGSICELRVWATPLSGRDIQQRLGIQLQGNEEGLIAYFPLDEGFGLIAADYAPLGRHAYFPKDAATSITTTTSTANTTSPGIRWGRIGGAAPCAVNQKRPTAIGDFVPSLLAASSGREVSSCISSSSLVVAVPTDSSTVQIFVYRRDCGYILEQEVTVRVPEGWRFFSPTIDAGLNVLQCLLLPKPDTTNARSPRVCLYLACGISPKLSNVDATQRGVAATTILKLASEKAAYLLSAWDTSVADYPGVRVHPVARMYFPSEEGRRGRALDSPNPMSLVRCQLKDISSLILDPSPLAVKRLVSWAVQLRLRWLQQQQASDADMEVDLLAQLQQVVIVLCLNIQAMVDQKRELSSLAPSPHHQPFPHEELLESPCNDVSVVLKHVKAMHALQPRAPPVVALSSTKQPQRTPFPLPRPPQSSSSTNNSGPENIATLPPLRQLLWLAFMCLPSESTSAFSQTTMPPPRLLMHSLPLVLTEEAILSFVIRVSGRRAQPPTVNASAAASPTLARGSPEGLLYDACIEYLTPMARIATLSPERLLALSAALFAEAASSEIAKQINLSVVRALHSVFKLLSSRFLNGRSQPDNVPSDSSQGKKNAAVFPVITFAVQLFRASEASIASCASALRRGEGDSVVQLISDGYVGQLVPLLCLILPQQPSSLLLSVTKGIQQLREGLQSVLSYCSNHAVTGARVFGRSGSISTDLGSIMDGRAIASSPKELVLINGSAGVESSTRVSVKTVSGLANSLLLAWSQISFRLMDVARSSGSLSSSGSISTGTTLGGKYFALFRGGLQRVGAQRDAALKSLNHGVGAIGKLFAEIQQEHAGLRAKDAALMNTERVLFGAFCGALLPTSSLVAPSKAELTHIFEFVKNMRQWILSERQQDPTTVDSAVKKASILMRFEPCVVDDRWSTITASTQPRNDLRAALREAKHPPAHPTAAATKSSSSSSRSQWRNTFTVWKAFRQLRSLVATLKGGDDINEAKAAQLLIDFLQDKSFHGDTIEGHLQMIGGRGGQVLEGLSNAQRILDEFCGPTGGRISRTVIRLLMRAFCGWHYLDGLQGCSSEIVARVRGVYFHILDSVLKEARHAIGSCSTGTQQPDGMLWVEVALSMLASSWARSDFTRLGEDIPQLLLRLSMMSPKDLSPNPTAALPHSVSSSRVASEFCAPSISVGASGLVLKGNGLRGSAMCPGAWSEASSAVRRSIVEGNSSSPTALRSLLPYSVLFFEVLFVDVSPNASITVGVGPTDYNLFRPPGWEPGSFAIQDDGTFFSEKCKGVLSEPMSLGNGDVLGCGWDIATGKLFWTHNEKKLAANADVPLGFLFGSDRATEARAPRDLCPLIGLDSKCLVRLNFGADPFVFDLSSRGAKPVMLLGQRSWAVFQSFSLNVSMCHEKNASAAASVDQDDTDHSAAPRDAVADQTSPIRRVHPLGSESVEESVNKAMVNTLNAMSQGLTAPPPSDVWLTKLTVLIYQVVGSLRPELPQQPLTVGALRELMFGLLSHLDRSAVCTPLHTNAPSGGSDTDRCNQYFLILRCLHKLLTILSPAAVSAVAPTLRSSSDFDSPQRVIETLFRVGELADLDSVSRQPIGWLAIRILRSLNHKDSSWQPLIHELLTDRLVKGRSQDKWFLLMLPLAVLGGSVFPLPGDTVLRKPKMFGNGTLVTYSLDDEIAFTRPEFQHPIGTQSKASLPLGEVGSHAYLHSSRAAVVSFRSQGDWLSLDDPLHMKQLIELLTTANQLWTAWRAAPVEGSPATSGKTTMVLKSDQSGPDATSMMPVHVRLLRCLSIITEEYTKNGVEASAQEGSELASVIKVCLAHIPMFTHWTTQKPMQTLLEDELIHSAALRELAITSGRRGTLLHHGKSPLKPSPLSKPVGGTPETGAVVTSQRRGDQPSSLEGDRAAVDASRLRLAQELSMQGFSLEMCMFALEQTYYDRAAALRMLSMQQDDMVWYDEREEEEEEEHDEEEEEGDEISDGREEDEEDILDGEPDDDEEVGDDNDDISNDDVSGDDKPSSDAASDEMLNRGSNSDPEPSGDASSSGDTVSMCLKTSSFIKMNVDIVLGHQFSIDVWLRLKDIEKTQLLLWQKGPVELRIQISERHLKFGWWDADGHGREQCCSLELFPSDVGSWNRFTFVQDLDQLYIYKGTTAQEFVISQVFDCLRTNFSIGGSARYPSQTLQADINNIRIFDCALSSDGVRNLRRMCPRGANDSIAAIHLKCSECQLPLINAASTPSLIGCTVEVCGPGVSWVGSDGQPSSSAVSPIGTGRRALYPGVQNMLVPTLPEVDLSTQPDGEPLFGADVPVDYDSGMGAQLRDLRKLSSQQCASRYSSVAHELCAQYASRILLGTLILRYPCLGLDCDFTNSTAEWIHRVCNIVCECPDEELHNQAEMSIRSIMAMLSDKNEGTSQTAFSILGAMLTELCSIVKVPQAVTTFESSHPAKVLTEPPKGVHFANQQFYDLYFDKKGVSGNVLFTFYTDHTLGHVIAHHSGYSLRIKAKKFYFDVRIDGAGPQWGYRMSVVYNGARQTTAAGLLRLLIQEGCAVSSNCQNAPANLKDGLTAHLFNKKTAEALLVGASVTVAKCRRVLLSALTHALRLPWMFIPAGVTSPAALEDRLPVFHQLSELRKAADKQFRQELGLSIHSKFIQAVMQLHVASRDAERAWDTAVERLQSSIEGSPVSPLPESAEDDVAAFLAVRSKQKKLYANRTKEGTEKVELVKQSAGERLRIEQSPEKTFHVWSEHLRAAALANVAMAGGKWYFEVRMVASADISIGVVACSPAWLKPWGLNGRTGVVHTCDSRVSASTQPRRWKVKDIVGVVIDAETRVLQYYVNGIPLDVTVEFGIACADNSDGAASAGWDDNDSANTTTTLDPNIGLSPWFALGPEAAATINFGSAPFDMEIPPGCLPLDASNLGVGSLVPFNQLRAFEEVMVSVAGGYAAPPFIRDEYHSMPSDTFRRGPLKPTMIPDLPTNSFEDVCNQLTNVGNKFATTKADVSVSGGGKWYYEATVQTQGLMQIGWSRSDSVFSQPLPKELVFLGVGDTKDSVGIDLYRGCLWQFGNKAPLTQARRWAVGDVIGCGVDLDAREVFFTSNGRGLVRVSASVFRGAAVTPAITMRPGNTVTVNFGTQPLKYKPEGYSALGVPDTWAERVDTYFSSSDGAILQRRLVRLAELSSKAKPRLNGGLSAAYREVITIVDQLCVDSKKTDVLQLKEDTIMKAVEEAAVTSEALRGKNFAELSNIVQVLTHLSKLASGIVPLIYFDLDNAPLLSRTFLQSAPHYIWAPTREAIVTRILKETNSRSDHFRITINRSKARGSSSIPFASTIFGQTVMLLSDQHPRIFKTSKRFWTVNFAGEGAEDAGGPFREHISDICSELMSDILPLFVPTANNTNNAGECREGFVPRAGAKGLRHATMYRFIGRMMGGALRNGEPLNLYLPQLFWKKLLRCPVVLADLGNVDQTCVQCVREFSGLNQYGDAAEEVFDSTFEGETFTTTLSDGTVKELIPKGASTLVTYSRCQEYAEALATARLDEFDVQVGWIREGLLNVVPEIVLALLRPNELEAHICGKPDYMVSELKQDTSYEGLPCEDRRVKFMWQVLEEATPKQRRLFLRFVSGRERLPVKLRVLPFATANRDPNSVFPKAATCFFAIELPDYSSVEIMRQRLIYTVENCAEIDTDFRARETDDDGPLLHIGSEDRPEDDPALTVPE